METHFSRPILNAWRAAGNLLAGLAVIWMGVGPSPVRAASAAPRSAPVIASPPADLSVSAGQTVSFSAHVTGNPAPKLQWKKNGTAITGATDATLTLSKVSGGSSGTYTVVATNAPGSASASAVLTVNTAPAIATSPASRTANIGQTVSFAATATVSGNFAPSFEWRKNGVVVTGGQVTNTSLTQSNGLQRSVTSVLTFASAQAGDSASYTAVATNLLGTVTSSAALLKVNTAPVIGTQPANQRVSAGQSAAFTVSASGTAQFTFEWQRAAAGSDAFVRLTNGAGITGATTATLSVAKTGVAMTGDRFRVVVTNALGTASSSAATLTVSKTPAAVTLSGLTQVFNGTPRAVTVKTNPAGLAVSLSYDGSVTVPTNPGTYPVVATVTAPTHSGSASGSLVIAKAPATITLSGLAQTFNGDLRAVTANTSPAGLTVSITYAGSGMPPTTMPPTDAGSYTVASTIDDAQRTGTKSAILVIAKAAQKITFDPLPVKRTNDGFFTLTASANSGLMPSYSSSNPAVATVSGSSVVIGLTNTATISLLMIGGAGTTTITASVPGDRNHLAASKVSRTLTVMPAPTTSTLPATALMSRLSAVAADMDFLSDGDLGFTREIFLPGARLIYDPVIRTLVPAAPDVVMPDEGMLLLVNAPTESAPPFAAVQIYSLGGRQLWDLTWNGSLYVAVGDGDAIFTSPDGLEWTAGSTETSTDLANVMWDGTAWLVMGNRAGLEGSDLNNTNVFFISSDAKTWLETDGDSFWASTGSSGLIRATVGEDGVALGGEFDQDGYMVSGGFLFSTSVERSMDAIATLNRIMTPSFIPVVSGAILNASAFTSSVAPVSGTLALNRNPNVQIASTSPGGALGSLGVISPGSSSLAISGSTLLNLTESSSLGFFAGTVSAPLSTPLIVLSGTLDLTGSVDVLPVGSTLRVETSGTVRFTPSHLGGSTSLVVGTPAGLTAPISPIAVPGNFTLGGTPIQSRDVAWNGSLYVAVGDQGLITTSSDGLNWSLRSLSPYFIYATPVTTANLLAVMWDGAKWLAVGSLPAPDPSGSPTSILLSSPDGMTWAVSPAP